MDVASSPARPRKTQENPKRVTQNSPLAFQFITSTDPHDKVLNRQAARAIKSHVMRRFQHERKQKTINDLVSAYERGALKTALSLLQSGKRRNQEATPEYHNLPLYGGNYQRYDAPLEEIFDWSPFLSRCPLDSSKSDPFQSLPIITDPASNLLLDFYEGMYPGKGGIPANPTKALLNRLLSHKATMHAILLFSALSYRQQVADAGLGTTEYHRNMVGAIRSVNDALDDPIERYSDAIVGAIILLARNEVVAANFESARYHFKALQKIVKARGGLQCLGWNGMLARLIFWVDNFLSAIHLTTPLFPLMVVQEDTVAGRSKSILIMDVDIASVIITLDPSSIAQALKELSLESESRRHFSSEDVLRDYSDRLIYQEYHLASWIRVQKLGKNEQLSSIDAIEHSFYVAALMYIYIALREQPINHHHFINLLRRLTQILTQLGNIPEVSDLKTSIIPHPVHILFWTLFVGGVSGEGGPDELYFRELLQELLSHLNVQSWEQARELLKEVAWIPRFCEARWKNMWDKTTLNKLGDVYAPKLLWFQDRWRYQDARKVLELRTEDNVLD